MSITPPDFLLPNNDVFWVVLNGVEGLLVPSFRSYKITFDYKTSPKMKFTDHHGNSIESSENGTLLITRELAKEMVHLRAMDPETNHDKEIKIFPTETEYKIRVAASQRRPERK
jgi:hypothetical protein